MRTGYEPEPEPGGALMQRERRMRERVGLIVVDHGSTRSAANDMLIEVVKLFREVSGHAIVEPAHMEIARPTIEEAFTACVAQGATEIVVHPYFLAPGKHSTADIPRMTRQAAKNHPGVAYRITDPLGIDEKIVRLIQQRIEEALSAEPAADQERQAA